MQSPTIDDIHNGSIMQPSANLKFNLDSRAYHFEVKRPLIKLMEVCQKLSFFVSSNNRSLRSPLIPSFNESGCLPLDLLPGTPPPEVSPQRRPVRPRGPALFSIYCDPVVDEETGILVPVPPRTFYQTKLPESFGEIVVPADKEKKDEEARKKKIKASKSRKEKDPMPLHPMLFQLPDRKWRR